MANIRYIGILLPVSIFLSIHRHGRTKFRPNPSIHGWVMTSYPFMKTAAGSHNGFRVGSIRPPTKCNSGASQLGLLMELIGFTVSEILPFSDFSPWNCLFTLLFPPHMRRIKRKFTSGVESIHIFGFVGVDLPIQYPTSKGVASRISGV